MGQGKFGTLIARPLYYRAFNLFLAEKISGRLAILSSFIWLHSIIKIYLGTGKHNVRFTFPQNCTILRQVKKLTVLDQSGQASYLNWTIQIGSIDHPLWLPGSSQDYWVWPFFEGIKLLTFQVIDVIDILADNIYFTQVNTCNTKLLFYIKFR